MKNQPTKEMLIRFARRHTLDIDGYYQDEKERDPHKREIDAIVRQLKAVRKQRDSFHKQRDELINDMQNVKRKAEAWDKLKEYVLDRNEAFSDRKDCAQSPQQFEYFENLLTAFKVIKTKMNDLERGSDERTNYIPR
ncbi:hypothetical protein [Staphylococcus hominis]|uniref:hypothetical protein n=1 Tax=Staphylococcus hominis TaxID=1290 RepID=UPI0031BAC02A